MQKITSIINNQQGSVIVMAVIVLVLLTIIGISATNTSTSEVQVSTNAALHNVAFYAADSGIEAGRAALNSLRIADVSSWDNLLFNLNAADEDKKSIKWNGADCTPNVCWTLDDILDAAGGRTVGPATFTLAIEDNNDLDGNDEVDSDNTIFLTSTLVSPYRNATATIRTSVQGSGEAYAQEHYDTGNTGLAFNESAEIANQSRW